MTVPSTYRPGACNIGSAARRERRRVALLCFVGAVGYAAFVLVTSAPTILLLGLFVPLSLGIEWSLQARRSFCVALALQGGYDFRETATDGGSAVDERGSVEDRGARSEDRRYALRLTLLGIAGGAVLTSAVYAVAVALG
ncbi:MAG: hypothetical protein ABEJ05_05950 [Haloglomus sp.]